MKKPGTNFVEVYVEGGRIVSKLFRKLEGFSADMLLKERAWTRS